MRGTEQPCAQRLLLADQHLARDLRTHVGVAREVERARDALALRVPDQGQRDARDALGRERSDGADAAGGRGALCAWQELLDTVPERAPGQRQLLPVAVARALAALAAQLEQLAQVAPVDGEHADAQADVRE